MKSRTLIALFTVAGLGLVAWADPGAPVASSARVSAQPPQPPQPAQMAALIADLRRQNELMTQQQAQMDEKIEKISEAVRQARLLAARSGGKGGR